MTNEHEHFHNAPESQENIEELKKQHAEDAQQWFSLIEAEKELLAAANIPYIGEGKKVFLRSEMEEKYKAVPELQQIHEQQAEVIRRLVALERKLFGYKKGERE